MGPLVSVRNTIGFACAWLAVLPFGAYGQHSECPRFDGDRNNVLTNVRLFDGAVAENVELVPDNEHGATWDIRGYQATDRQLVLRCEYRNRSSIEIPVDYLASRCYVKGRVRLRAWCGK